MSLGSGVPSERMSQSITERASKKGMRDVRQGLPPPHDARVGCIIANHAAQNGATK